MSHAFDVDLTYTADRQIRALRGRRQKAALRILEELIAGGCERAGYRLTGDATIEHLCCRHLYASDRAITAWPAPNQAIVIAVGAHDESPTDIYRLILEALGIDMAEGERLKPPCCDGRETPPVDLEAADLIAAAIDALTRRSRQS